MGPTDNCFNFECNNHIVEVLRLLRLLSVFTFLNGLDLGTLLMTFGHELRRTNPLKSSLYENLFYETYQSYVDVSKYPNQRRNIYKHYIFRIP